MVTHVWHTCIREVLSGTLLALLVVSLGLWRLRSLQIQVHCLGQLSEPGSLEHLDASGSGHGYSGNRRVAT